MSGRHRKHGHLALKITGGLVAGAALTSTFAMSANADTPAQQTLAVKSSALPGMPLPETGSMTTAGKPAEAAAKAAKPEQARQEATAAQMIAKAKTQLGEKETNGGETKFAEWYSKTDRAAETIERDGGNRKGYLDANWCDMFVSWTASQVGADDIVGQDAWTVAHAKWFKEKGKWSTKPKKGAIVFFSWDGSKSLDSIEHVGIVTGVRGDGKVDTIEGNTGNKVQLKTRSAGQIVGYGLPDYKNS